jgi:DNA-damage-inducible protein D
MKKEQIQKLFEQFENAAYEYKGIECWSARELQEILGYSEWRNFFKVIDKAKDACKNSGAKITDQFVDVNKLIDMAKGAQRQIDDVALTRYACYLIAQNADAEKVEIAFAQTYFAVQTRKQEIIG